MKGITVKNYNMGVTAMDQLPREGKIGATTGRLSAKPSLKMTLIPTSQRGSSPAGLLSRAMDRRVHPVIRYFPSIF